MYQPSQFVETRLEVQHAAICAHPFGLLISSGSQGLEANGIPFVLDTAGSGLGVLQAHVARANEQWKTLEGQNVLVVFQGPQAYISPSHYETKRQTGKVVPTWNYVMVQARGVARVKDDAAWLALQIARLTNIQETSRAKPWAVFDAPETYIAAQIRGIVGIEIEIETLEGKWKVSQNRPEADRRGVAEGLSSSNAEMAGLVRHFGGLEG